MRSMLKCLSGNLCPLSSNTTLNKLCITLTNRDSFVCFSDQFYHLYINLLLCVSLQTTLLFFVKQKMSAAIFNFPVAASGYVGLATNPSKNFPAKDSIGWTKKTVSNGSRTCCMKTWNPINNKKFETLSYLPPLSDDSIAKEIDYMLKKGWIPCLEFDEVGYVRRENSRMPGYYDGRYWTLWKLPMFGCTDPSLVLNEIQECKKTYPNAYIRCLAFDNQNQGQCMAFIIQKPTVAATTSA